MEEFTKFAKVKEIGDKSPELVFFYDQSRIQVHVMCCNNLQTYPDAHHHWSSILPRFSLLRNGKMPYEPLENRK